MKKKSLVTISRHWDNPQILTKIDLQGISMSIHLSAFKEAIKNEMESTIINVIKDRLNILKNEIGSPIFYFTQGSIERVIDKVFNKINNKEEIYKIFDKVFDDIVEKIKEESAKAV